MNIALFAIRHSLFHTARIRRRDFFWGHVFRVVKNNCQLRALFAALCTDCLELCIAYGVHVLSATVVDLLNATSCRVSRSFVCFRSTTKLVSFTTSS